MASSASLSPRAAAALRWSFLREWLTELQKHLYYHEREELDGGTLHSGLRSLCVFVPWPIETTDEYARQVTKLREAMELVGMALRLDKAAWKLVARKGCPGIEEFDPDDYDDGDLTPRFMLKAYPYASEDSTENPPNDTPESIGVIERLLAKNKDVPLSTEYLDARMKLLAMDSLGVLTKFQIPISLLFSPIAAPGVNTVGYMKTVSDMTRKVDFRSRAAMQDGVHGRIWYPFKVESVVFHPWDLAKLDRTIKNFVTSTLLRGIAMPELALKLDGMDPIELGNLFRVICHLLLEADRRPARIDALMVMSTRVEPFLAMCSAIVNSQSLSRLQLFAGFGGNRKAKWRALGAALLSCVSTSSVRELYIDEDKLLLSDAVVFQKGANSPYPRQDLACRYGLEETTVDRMVQLSDGAAIRLQSDGRDWSLSDLYLPSTGRFYVLEEALESEWTEILAPGYGKVYARCEDVVDALIVDRDAVSAASRGRITQFHIAFNHCEPGALSTIMKTLGASLISLNIDVKESKLVTRSDVKAILNTCKQLKLLRLRRAKIRSMDVFVRAYERGQCQISRLSLWNVYVSNASLRDFATTLSDPNHRMAQTLREFRYIFDDLGCPGDFARPDPAGIDLFLNMLALNATLSFFEIGLCEAYRKRFGGRFHERDNQLLVTHPSDLALSAKLAFLSCVGVSSHRGAKRSRPAPHSVRLTRDIVERIFFFARKRVYRVVSGTPIVERPKKASRRRSVANEDRA